MVNLILNFLSHFSPESKAFILSGFPIVELRGAIPLGLSLGLPTVNALLIALVGSILPLPFIFFGIGLVFKVLNRCKTLGKKVDGLS